ncbi:hypothetical protein OIE68_44065 [Nocardia vinacea]|uniref:hypothetical protein n=1 Tax=Nocardia vinacea TaxID=96468 RepID=UPI002E153620|nr:hypothetical protein OIE68_44065 [Nocardia vinacea]
MSSPERFVVDTEHFGKIVITRADERVVTTPVFDDGTVVTIERIGPRTRQRVPIGTRNTKRLRASINDRPIRLTVGRGHFYYRWTYRAVAEVDGKILRLMPTNLHSSTLMLGQKHQGDHVLGEFMLTGTHQIEVVWALPFTSRGPDATVRQPTLEDALVAYTLVTAFGTGGVSLWDLVEMVLPI